MPGAEAGPFGTPVVTGGPLFCGGPLIFVVGVGPLGPPGTFVGPPGPDWGGPFVIIGG